ncbi:unnamed protein product [Clonostachys chloroleuca]|uniref:Uncharacterized protein n=1 Tax=Clonostachys chloroleuca TaxID=1926264 RepID=A0AA35M1W3_9HYPO|nr:unnamed protein product [Clonostachys chloroleuca]
MWNSHSINIGVWAKFLPVHNHASSSRYAESLLWGPSMYVYFCAGFGIVGSKMFILDSIIENLAIRITHGYGFAKHTFLIYESIFVVSFGCVFTVMRLKAFENGRSTVEAGYEHWYPRLQNAVRTGAVI